jgi:hypothetical protein
MALRSLSRSKLNRRRDVARSPAHWTVDEIISRSAKGVPILRRSFLLFSSSIIVLIGAISTQAQTPKLVHSKSLSTSGEPGNGFKIQYGGSMGTGTLTSNLLTLRMTYPHGSTVSSISDNKSSIYTLGASADSGTNGWVTALYYVPGAAAGITQITVTFSASVADWHGAVQEYSGVATSSPGDGTCSSSTTTPPSVQCSSGIVTGTAGDLIVASAMLVGGLGGNLCGNTSTSIAPGGSFILDAADPYCSDAEEEFVQPSAGSITPAFSVAGNSDAFNIVAVAFKPSPGAGTNPTGMYILHQQTVQINEGTSSQPYYFVSAGNLLIASVDDGNTNSGGNVVTIDTCTPSNNWTKRSPAGFDAPQMFFVPSLSASTNMLCTVHSGMPTDTTLMVIYDVVGAASSPEDVDSAYSSNTGTIINAPVITPTTQPGIAFAVENTGLGPSSGVGPGFNYDNTPYASETDAGRLNNGDGWQHVFYTSTAPLSFRWTQVNGSSTMQAFAIAFKGNPVSQPAPPTNLKVTSVQ